VKTIISLIVVLFASLSAAQTLVGFAPSICSRYSAPLVSSITVKTEHPRLIMTRTRFLELRTKYKAGALNSDISWTSTLSAAKSLATKSDAELQSLLKSWSNIEWVMITVTFAAAISEDATLINASKRMANWMASSRYVDTSSKDTYARLTTVAMAYVYDWLYDKLTTTERTRYRADIDYRLTIPEMRINATDFASRTLQGHDLSAHTGMLVGGLAIYQDSSAARSLLQTYIFPHLVNTYFPFYDYIMGCDGSLPMGQYTSAYGDGIRGTLDIFTAATSVNMFQRFPNFKNLAYFLAQIKGNNTTFMDGDTYHNTWDVNFGDVFANIAKVYNDGIAKGLYEAYKAKYGSQGTQNWKRVIWGNSTVTALPLTAISKSKFYDKTGQLFVRSGWEKDSSIPRVSAMFTSAPYHFVGHHHRDMNHFEVYYKGNQLVDSGTYDTYAGTHWLNYYMRTIAHNTITVFNPAEAFNSPWGNDLTNDGGQQLGNPSPNRVAELKDPAFDYGGITHAEDTADYTWGIGRAEKAYAKVSSTGALSGKKLNYYARHFLFLKKVTGAKQPVIVIYDDLDKTNANYDSKFLLHTNNRPAYGSRIMSATEGGGRVQAQFLLPQSFTATIIGGSGKEYWVDGANYPVHYPNNSIPGDGAYRLEVSNSASTLNDKYLAVIYAGDPTNDPAPSAQIISTGVGFAEIRVGNYRIRFTRDDVVVTKL
jgi:hypothetical protein